MVRVRSNGNSRTLDRSEWVRSRVHYGFLPAVIGWVLVVSSSLLAHRFITMFGSPSAKMHDSNKQSKVVSLPSNKFAI